jgi:response regulator of citrate/malate metabolism
VLILWLSLSAVALTHTGNAKKSEREAKNLQKSLQKEQTRRKKRPPPAITHEASDTSKKKVGAVFAISYCSSKRYLGYLARAT